MSDVQMTAPEPAPKEVPLPPRDAKPEPAEQGTPARKDEPRDLDTIIKDSFNKVKADADAKSGKEPAKPEPASKEMPKGKEAAREPETAAAKEQRQRDEATGRFASKEAKTPSATPAEPAEGSEPEAEAKSRPSEGRDYSKPPARFLPRAKEAWANTPDEVRGEVHRAIENMEHGLTEHREAKENWEKLKDFDQQAKALGTTIPDYIRNVRAIETLLQSNPVEGIRRVLQTAGITPEQYARHVLGQAQQQPQQRQQADPQITGALTQMQQIVQRQQQRLDEMEQEKMMDMVTNRFIEPFKADHPRYDELEEDIAFFLNSGKIPTTLSERERLETAYDMAERINPAPKFASASSTSAPPAPRPLNPAGQKSVTGSPTPGLSSSKPANADAKDLDGVLKRAFARAGARAS